MGGGGREQQQQHLPQHLPQRRGTAAGAGRLDSECRRERQADLVSNPPPEAERGQSGNPSWVKNTNASNVTLTLSVFSHTFPIFSAWLIGLLYTVRNRRLTASS